MAKQSKKKKVVQPTTNDNLDFSQLKIGQHLLITLDDYFMAQDGEMYRFVYGPCYMQQSQACFGFQPSGNSTNWFMQVGDGENAVFIMGCRIHYACICLNPPVQRKDLLIVKD